MDLFEGRHRDVQCASETKLGSKRLSTWAVIACGYTMPSKARPWTASRWPLMQELHEDWKSVMLTLMARGYSQQQGDFYSWTGAIFPLDQLCVSMLNSRQVSRVYSPTCFKMVSLYTICLSIKLHQASSQVSQIRHCWQGALRLLHQH